MTEAQRIAVALANAACRSGAPGVMAGRAALLRLAPLGLALLASVSAHALLLSWLPDTVISISVADIGQTGIRVALVSAAEGGSRELEAGEVEEWVSTTPREARRPAPDRDDVPGYAVADLAGDAAQQPAATPVLEVPAQRAVTDPAASTSQDLSLPKRRTTTTPVVRRAEVASKAAAVSAGIEAVEPGKPVGPVEMAESAEVAELVEAAAPVAEVATIAPSASVAPSTPKRTQTVAASSRKSAPNSTTLTARKRQIAAPANGGTPQRAASQRGTAHRVKAAPTRKADGNVEGQRSVAAESGSASAQQAAHNSTAGAGKGIATVTAGGPNRPPPRYPSRARRRGLQGRVVLLVRVGAGGGVAEIRIDQSSSHRLLDRAALKTVRDWRFAAHAQRWVRVPIVFRLQG